MLLIGQVAQSIVPPGSTLLYPTRKPCVTYISNGINLYCWYIYQKIESLIALRLSRLMCELNGFLAATKQLYKWYFPSVRPSVRLSVCHTFWLCSNHRIIMKFSGVITNDQSKVHAKGQGQRSKVKVTTQLNPFRIVTPVWIVIWWWNDAYSLPYCFLMSSVKFQGHTALKIVELDPDWAFPDCNSSLNSPMATKWCTKLEVALKRCPIVFKVIRQISRSHG